ncbi:beta-fructofuranosidase [Marinococcus luteus]|uniref:Sucrose-6-phosphate hydrolase n=1 Tax=Marinococcus luteus TaxID=1122204 RepID=A0A1H2QMM9_9BACI|nr:sucrose-6-phosphate hydrolase [Marinococcus luteus]SDW08138.1 beta-fructofuranosidase [Marinococcus luteus]
MLSPIDFTNRKNRFLSMQDISADYVIEMKNKVSNDPYYPSYHIAPKHGLLNDPNGLVYHEGRHHIFYQWFPLGPVHGLKHWYHVSTEDFITFKDHGLALAPSEKFDSHGCYSGCAYVKDSEVHVLYTGNHLTEDGQVEQSQIHALMNQEMEISDKALVLPEPPDHFKENFRDPFIFVHEEEYYMLVGGEQTNGCGALAVYKGESIEDLHYQGALQTGFGQLGFMWECPNYFEDHGHGVLIFSPQGEMPKTKYDYNNVFSSVYAVGNPMDKKTMFFDAVEYQEIDKGFDFYAPQIYKDHNDRRILIGWLGNSKSAYPTDKNMWAHMLTLPREIHVKNQRMIQTPLEELQELRSFQETIRPVHEIQNGSFELEIQIEKDFEISFMNSEGDAVVFSSNGEEYCLNRSQMTQLYAEAYGTVRYARRQMNSSHWIRIFTDQSSLEIFCDNGETVFTSRFFIENLNTIRSTGVTGWLYGLKAIHMSEE